jgi:pimeloyl-ACP methyl ester carboxylesterase
VTHVNGKLIQSVPDFLTTLSALRAGERIAIDFIRANKHETLTLMLKPRPGESSPLATTDYGSVAVDGTLRRTIITIPKNASPQHPALLYLTGIGCVSQESLDLSDTEARLLYGLTSAGFITMRVEKSGVGDSQGRPCTSREIDLEAEVRGYLAGLTALKRLPQVDSRNVFLVGLSIGGVEAPLLAQKGGVRGVVVINTVAKPLLEYLVATRRRQNLLRNPALDEMENRLRMNELCNHRLLIERVSHDELLRQQPACNEYVDFPAPDAYMQQWAALNMAAEWKKVDAPVLVAFGSADYISSIEDNPYLVGMINSFHPGNASLREIARMDHYLATSDSMQQGVALGAEAKREFQPAVVDTVAEWLKSQLARPSDPPLAPSRR